MPLVAPALWRPVPCLVIHGRRWVHAITELSVILSAAAQSDGRVWLHVSVAHQSRMPSWQELVDVKEWLFGFDRYAAQIVPPRSEYVNKHPFCLHLFTPADGPWPLPDFTVVEGGEKSL